MTLYDDALPEFAAAVYKVLGPKILDHTFLRDSAGYLTLLVSDPLLPEELEKIKAEAQQLGPWVDQALPIATKSDLFDQDTIENTSSSSEYIDHPDYTGYVRIVERRVVGQDWLREPAGVIHEAPPIVVFASHKGGVGRSTALAVSAFSMSKRGLNVLVVDLDLEAPGLGSILLRQHPSLGSLDYFVEAGVSTVNDDLLESLVASSELTENGLIHVVPAVGTQSLKYPQNVLGKIARAYVEYTDAAGRTITFLDRTRDLITRLVARRTYDAVFIDARAGLNEATAAAILGLGAEVLFFGVDTPQTFHGYRYLFAHLSRFRPAKSDEDDWRYKFRMVQAKAKADPKALSEFRTKTFALFADTLYDSEEGIEEEALNFDYDDDDAPHYAWPILNDSNYNEFNPIDYSDQFSEFMYDRTFGPFINALMSRIGLDK
jgi:hypothetical protein